MSLKLLLGSLTVGAGVLALVLQSEPEPRYAYRVADFLASDLHDREVRVSGYLVHDTLCRVSAECGYRFAIADGLPSLDSRAPSSLHVQYDGCVLPDTFRDIENLDTPVVVQGQRCQSCHEFRASQLLAKCTGKYEMPVDGGLAHSAAPPPPRCDALAPRM